MDKDTKPADISKTELNLLVNALTKSVDMNYSRRFFWFALVLAFFIGMAVVYISLPVKNLQQTETAKVCLEESDEIKKSLYDLDLKIDRLSLVTDSIISKLEDEKKYDKPVIEKDESNKIPLNKKMLKDVSGKPETLINPASYTVTIHYNLENKKKIILNLSEFLRGRKYNVPTIQKVKYKKTDIRYFHKKDKDAAMIIREEVNAFIARHTDIKNIKLNLIDLSKAYPDAPAGLIELWINLL